MPKSKAYQQFLGASVSTAVVASVVTTGMVPSAQAEEISFSDVNGNDYFYEAVSNLSDRQIIKGYDDGTFRPYQTVTRAQAAKMLAMSLDLNLSNTKNPGFTDVKTSDWYYGSVAALVDAGIIKGYDDQTFRPNETLTRAQMAKMIALGFKLGETSVDKFSDVKNSDWYAGYVGSLVEKEITTGTTPTTFSPNKNITRGQMAAFIYRTEQANKPVSTLYKIDSVTDSAVVINGVSYRLDNHVKSILHKTNADILKNAVIEFEENNNVITKVTSLEIKEGATVSKDQLVFDGKNGFINGDLKISADYILVQNITVKGNLELSNHVNNNFYGKNVQVEGKTVIAAEVKQSANISKGKVSQTLAYKQKEVAATEENTVSITLENASIGVLEIRKENIAVTAKGNTTMEEVHVYADTVLSGDSKTSTEKLIIENGVKTVQLDMVIEKAVLKMNDEIELSGKGSIKDLVIEDKKVKINLGKDTKLSNVTLPSGTKVEDLFKNYNDVKSNISKVDGKSNSTSSSGGSRSSSSSNSGNSIPSSGEITVAGTYGPQTGKQTINGNLVVKSKDVTLRNLVVTGNLVIDEAVGDGDVHLNGVEIQGTTTVKGGGENSIYFTDSVLVTVIVNKNDGKIRIVAQGNTSVVDLQLESYVKIEEEGLTGNAPGFTNVTLSEGIQNVDSNLQVSLEGAFDTVNSRARNVRINLSRETNIENLVVSALGAIISGNGNINTAEINDRGIELSVRPSNLVIQVPNTTVRIGNENIDESYSQENETHLQGVIATQGMIDVDLTKFVAGMTIDDFGVTATLNGEAVTLENLQYDATKRKIFYTPVSLEDNIGKTLEITVAPSNDSSKVKGNPVKASVVLNTGFEGRITDIHGVGVPSIKIHFRKDNGDSAIVETVMTDKYGYYSVNLPQGMYVGEMEGDGFVTSSLFAIAPSAVYNINQNETAIRAAATNELKILLSWNELPRDVDSHLVGPVKDSSNQFYIWYGDREFSKDSILYADLDWDDTDSYGPETTTIRQLVDGTYTFVVHNFSGEHPLSNSGAKVQVYKGNSKIANQTFVIPEGDGTEEYWTVFELTISNNGNVIEINPVNVLSSSTPDVLLGKDWDAGDIRSELNYMIEEAQYLYTEAEEGTEVGQYVLGAKELLKEALDTAEAVASNGDITEEEFILAIETLSTAIRTFEASQIVSISTTDLLYILEQANELHQSSREGTEVGEYMTGSKAALQEAIDAVQELFSYQTATQGEIWYAEGVLGEAIEQFYRTQLVETADTELVSTIAYAQRIYGQAQEGTGVGQYPVGSKVTLQEVIDVAQVVLEKGTTTLGEIWDVQESIYVAIENFLANEIGRSDRPGYVNELLDLVDQAQYLIESVEDVEVAAEAIHTLQEAIDEARTFLAYDLEETTEEMYGEQIDKIISAILEFEENSNETPVNEENPVDGEEGVGAGTFNAINAATFTTVSYTAGTDTLIISELVDIEEGSTFDLSKLTYSDAETTVELATLQGTYTLVGAEAEVDEAGEYFYDATTNELKIILTADDAATIEGLAGFGAAGTIADTLTAMQGWNIDMASIESSEVMDINVEVISED